jgi:hypothetical protein
MSRKNLRSARKLSLETLDGRSMMAGIVNVDVVQGDLVVTGDGGDNEVRVIQSLQNNQPIAGRYFISGLNGTVVRSSTIPNFNGFANNVTDDIRINLNGGNDRLTVGSGINGQFNVPTDLVIELGDGNNVVRVDHVAVRDDLSVTSGTGADSVFVTASVGTQIGVDGGANDITITTGNRADNVRLENTLVRNNLSVNVGGTDNFTDFVDLITANIGGDTDIRTGAGGDIVNVSNVAVVDDMIIDTGADADSVTVTGCRVDELFLFLGAGTDQVSVTNNSGRRGVVDGQGDADTRTQSGNNFIVPLQFLNF